MSVIFANDNTRVKKIFDDLQSQSLVILCDSNSKKYCLERFIDIIGIKDLPIIEIPHGEENKNITTCQYIWEHLLANKCDRKTTLINLGGGVVTDIGGFAAAVFKRGINFINVPTTLLSMVDASIGGKNGVDFLNIKNVLGTIVEPLSTIIDSNYLSTLDNRQIKSGFAEMLKHGLITDQNHWNELIQSDWLNLHQGLLNRSVEIKMQIVNEDLRENGLRKLLNFGHTIGHGIEAFGLKNNLDILHGEAIAAGIIVENYISFKKGLLAELEAFKVESEIKKIFGYIPLDKNSFSEIIDFIRQDKKNSNGKINFVLLQSIGQAVYDQDVDESLISEALDYYSKLNEAEFPGNRLFI